MRKSYCRVSTIQPPKEKPLLEMVAQLLHLLIAPLRLNCQQYLSTELPNLEGMNLSANVPRDSDKKRFECNVVMLSQSSSS